MPKTKQVSVTLAAKQVRTPAKTALKVATTRMLKVKFGQVVVTVPEPSTAAVKQGLKKSARVMAGLSTRLVNPGVVIKNKKDVPIFTADPSDPHRVVRRLNGKSERGSFVNGKFKAESVSA